MTFIKTPTAMKITTITYAFTQNLGNYQSRRLEVSAEVEESHPDDAFEELKRWVGEKLQLPVDKNSQDEGF